MKDRRKKEKRSREERGRVKFFSFTNWFEFLMKKAGECALAQSLQL